MKSRKLEPGCIVRFRKDGKTAEGTVRSAGHKRVHIQSGQTGVYVTPNDVICILQEPREDRVPLLGEEFRFHGGIDQ